MPRQFTGKSRSSKRQYRKRNKEARAVVAPRTPVAPTVPPGSQSPNAATTSTPSTTTSTADPSLTDTSSSSHATMNETPTPASPLVQNAVTSNPTSAPSHVIVNATPNTVAPSMENDAADPAPNDDDDVAQTPASAVEPVSSISTTKSANDTPSLFPEFLQAAEPMIAATHAPVLAASEVVIATEPTEDANVEVAAATNGADPVPAAAPEVVIDHPPTEPTKDAEEDTEEEDAEEDIEDAEEEEDTALEKEEEETDRLRLRQQKQRAAAAQVRQCEWALTRWDRGQTQRAALLQQHAEDAAAQLEQARLELLMTMANNFRRACLRQWWKHQLDQYATLLLTLTEEKKKQEEPVDSAEQLRLFVERQEEFDAAIQRAQDRIVRITERLNGLQPLQEKVSLPGAAPTHPDAMDRPVAMTHEQLVRHREDVLRHWQSVFQRKLQFRQQNVLTLQEQKTRHREEMMRAKEAALRHESQMLFLTTNIKFAEEHLRKLRDEIEDTMPLLYDVQAAETLVAQRQAEAQQVRDGREKLETLLREARATLEQCSSHADVEETTVDQEK